MSLLEQYETQGYVIVKSFFSVAEIAEIKNQVEPIYQTWLNENEKQVREYKLVNMHSLTSPDYFKGQPSNRAYLFNAITPKKLTDLLDQLFGEGIYFHNTQLFFNPSNKDQRPYWHRDMQYSPITEAQQKAEQNKLLSLHIRIPLEEETGLAVIPATHKRWDTEQEHQVRFELNNHKNHESLPTEKLIHLQQGDILIFNAQMIHRGNYSQTNPRKALDLCVGKYHPITAEFFDRAVLPTPQELAKITNPTWYTQAQKLPTTK